MHLNSALPGMDEALKPNIGPCWNRYWYSQRRKVLPKHSQPYPTLDWMKISDGFKTNLKLTMYLIDTNVISEARKKAKANIGVRRFFKQSVEDKLRVFISVVTVGELRRGVESIRHRGDTRQANQLEKWLEELLADYQDHILDINQDIAQLWGQLRVPHPENALDKQIAATALIYELTVVTRNHKDFVKTGVPVLNPWV
jgi:predicted nucleic acid-binding protein